MSAWSYLPPPDPNPLGDDRTTTATGGRRQRVGRRQLATVTAGLTERDHNVLESLAHLHHLTTRQIERLHFQEDAVAPLTAVRRAHRCLARLHALGLIDRLDRRVGGPGGGSAPYCWALSPAGARALDIPRRRRGPTPGIQHLAHTLDVAEVVVRLHEHARHQPIEIVAIETEPACWRSVTVARGPGWLKPDLRLTLRTPSHELHWFVEVDRGHERAAALTHKTARYLAAWRDGGEQARAGVFPRVLWIVPSPERAAAVDRICASTPGAPAGLFVVVPRTSAIDALTEPPQ